MSLAIYCFFGFRVRVLVLYHMLLRQFNVVRFNRLLSGVFETTW